MRRARVIAALLLTWACSQAVLAADAPAREPQVLTLRGGDPAAPATPTLSIWRPDPAKAIDMAVVVCPGGGYANLAMDHEGKQVAEWLNSFGVTACVLEYRHRGTGFGHPAPLEDAQRAIRMVRAQAAELKLNPKRIGILGFSAGGHLASSAGTHFVEGKADATDPIERVSSRPDFMILIYPVISMTEGYTHGGSRKNLLGDRPEQALVELMSNERQVTKQTPPTFMVHGDEDTGVPVENSLAFYAALRKAKVPAELHVFEKGPHGFGLGKPTDPASAWPKLCERWLKERSRQ